VNVMLAFSIMIVLVVVLFCWVLYLLNHGTGIRD